ncbi:unnamed protein product [Rotaria sp. Silwood2]|nr:unnamed protein product [Rotaria sp. Silwood2]
MTVFLTKLQLNKLESISHGKGQPVSRKAVHHVIDEVAKRKEKFHFSKQEIESLCTIFRHLTKSGDKEKIDRNRFRDILHNTFDMTDDILMDRVFKAFDRDNDGQVSMLEWVVGLNTYLRGTLDEKIAFAFTCYSLKGEKHITREEIFQLLKSSVLKQAGDEDPDESIKELVEITLKKMDKDHDNRLGDNDFSQSVREDPLLLSCFGQVFANARIDGMDSIKEIPIRVHISGNPIKTFLSTNKNDKSSSLPIVQFGSMLHNSLPIIKKVHMQNISHIPIRIDWVIYDITEDMKENSKLIELISVVDNNPFDSFLSETSIMENNDELTSQTTVSTKTTSRENSGLLSHSSASMIDDKPAPLIKLYVKPYQGKRSSDTNAIYSISSTTKIVKPREHFYLDITMTPRNCPIKDCPMKYNARMIGVLSVSEERQGSQSQGFHRPIFYEHEEQIEFEMHASLEMPSLRVELNDDDYNVDESEALLFAIPAGKKIF